MTGKTTVNKMGFIYSAFVFLILAIQLGISYVLVNRYPDLVSNYSVEISLLLTFVVEHVICFSILILMTRKVPAEHIVPKKLGAKKAIMAFFMMYTLMEAGALMGNFVQFKLTGEVSNAATELMLSSDPLPRIFVIGICAPIVEELIFRKLLIDRLIKHGAMLSIVASGLMFGLIHGNFSQFFYAFLLGSFFAAIYIMTGNISYTIVYHMIVNISSSVVGVYVLRDYTENGINSISYLIYSAFILISAIVGIVLIIVKSRDFVPHDEDIMLESEITAGCLSEENPEGEVKVTSNRNKASGKEFFTPGMITYYVMSVVMFLVNYGVLHL